MSDEVSPDQQNLALSEQEIAYLQGFALSLDRAGFYTAYYEMVRGADDFIDGADGVIATAKISTFSGAVGGVAFGANYLLQATSEFIDPNNGSYSGVYFLSQEVAESIFDAVLADRAGVDDPVGVVDNPTSLGRLTAGDILRASTRAWDDSGQANQFPGIAVNEITNSFLAAKGSYESTVTEPADIDVQRILQFISELEFLDVADVDDPNIVGGLLSGGTLASFLAVYGADLLGKRIEDYQDDDGNFLLGYRAVQSSDDRLISIIGPPDKVEAVFDGTETPIDALAIVQGAVTIVGTVATLNLQAILDKLTDVMSTFRRGLTESNTQSFNGDSDPNRVNFPAFAPSNPYSITNDQGGTTGDDSIVGTVSDDVISAEAGDDVVFGGGGIDTIDGGMGNDVIYGQAGNDVLAGGAGNDVIRGGEDDDRIFGGEGDDLLDGGSIGVTESGQDTLVGGAGNDVLVGGNDSDTLFGGIEDVDDNSELGNDRLYGGDGNDFLYGGGGRDELFGGEGGDFLAGGTGDDVLEGGAGHDVYEFSIGEGHDVAIDSGNENQVSIDGNFLGTIDQLTQNIFTDSGDRVFVKTGNDLVVISRNGSTISTVTLTGYLTGINTYGLTENPLAPPPTTVPVPAPFTLIDVQDGSYSQQVIDDVGLGDFNIGPLFIRGAAAGRVYQSNITPGQLGDPVNDHAFAVDSAQLFSANYEVSFAAGEVSG